MKRKKMQVSDMYYAGIEYFDFHRVKNENGEKGYRYILDKPLTDKQKSIVNSYKNTIISSCQYRYAPEIKYDTIIILDKCKKVV